MRGVEIDIADQFPVDLRHADVEHGRTGFDPVTLDHARVAGGRNQDVGAATDGVEVTRA